MFLLCVDGFECRSTLLQRICVRYWLSLGSYFCLGGWQDTRGTWAEGEQVELKTKTMKYATCQKSFRWQSKYVLVKQLKVFLGLLFYLFGDFLLCTNRRTLFHHRVSVMGQNVYQHPAVSIDGQITVIFCFVDAKPLSIDIWVLYNTVTSAPGTSQLFVHLLLKYSFYILVVVSLTLVQSKTEDLWQVYLLI